MRTSGHTAHRLVAVAWLVVGLVMLAGCGEDNTPEPPEVTATPLPNDARPEMVIYTPVGGKLVFSSFEMLMKAGRLPYEVTIMEGVTTDLTVQGLRDGVFDMIFLRSRPQPDDGIEFFEVLCADVAIFTHPDIAVDNLTTQEIAAIFAGEITNWSEVGGADQDIVLFVLPESDSATEAFHATMMDEKPFANAVRTHVDGKSVILSATRIAGGIGYATWASKNPLVLGDDDITNDSFHVVSVDGMNLDHPDYPCLLYTSPSPRD